MDNQFPQSHQIWPHTEPPKQNPVDLWKIVGINFGVFMLYQTLLVFVAEESYLILDMFPLLLHWLVMLILMIINFTRGKRMQGFGFLISLISIVIIGFGSCWWITDMLGGAWG